MSHFGLLVVLPCEERPTHREAWGMLHMLMAPYSEKECPDDWPEDKDWDPEDSEWDWWVIGGRWTGFLTDYEPDKEPLNYEPCRFCGATGTRSDAYVNGPCNACKATGQCIKHPGDWVQCPGDILRVRDALASGKQTFAVLTPRGWWSRERMNPNHWALKGDEQEKERHAFELAWASQLADYPNHWAVMVDCHT